MVTILQPRPRTLADVLAASLGLVRGTTVPAAVVRMPHPQRLRAARQAIAERARNVGATPAQRETANAIALRELAAGRSTAVALAIAYGALSGRANPLLPPSGPVPA